MQEIITIEPPEHSLLDEIRQLRDTLSSLEGRIAALSSQLAEERAERLYRDPSEDGTSHTFSVRLDQHVFEDAYDAFEGGTPGVCAVPFCDRYEDDPIHGVKADDCSGKL